MEGAQVPPPRRVLSTKTAQQITAMLEQVVTRGTAKDVGEALFTRYLLPFEVTSVLILIAIIGAIVLARKELE